LISEPGEKYNCSNYGYIVLGAILENVEEKSFQVIINNNILNVIKADNTQYALTENVKDKNYHLLHLGKNR
jgi:CubicO group peptidase (beta-lactamase class C family)